MDRAVDAHGGIERWRKVVRLDVRLSVSGFLFQIKGHPEGLHDVVADSTIILALDLKHRRYSIVPTEK
ncbi:MAG: hypothetical protein WA323_16760 [Candidatus Nitrosopolaris sp.]